jgi:hypothetical protein
MSPWWLLLLLAVPVALYASRGRGYAALYAPAHLAELGRGLLTLISRGADGLGATESPPHFVTSANLAVVVTRAPAADGGRYHLSLSRRGDVLAQGAALTLVAFLLDVLGFDPARASVSPSPNVTHVEFAMSADEERHVASAASAALDEADVRERLGRAMNARAHMSATR